MSDFRILKGFEDVWRAPTARRKQPAAVLAAFVGPAAVRARLARLVRRAPEVMVKVTGRTRDPAHLRAHLDYISRNGELALEGPDGGRLQGRAEVRELAADWSALASQDSRRRTNTPLSLSLVLSMPAGTDPMALRDAARAFADAAFGDRFDYVFALHTDAPHPHVHVTARAMGWTGERLNPRPADLDAWRQTFARELRARGVEAEATPRRARGITRKPERTAVRKLRERADAGRGPMAQVQRAAIGAAARLAFGGASEAAPWEAQLLARQRRIRALYLGQARLLQSSTDPVDHSLGRAVEAFVRDMPAPETQRLALARALRAAGERGRPAAERPGGVDPVASRERRR